LNGLSAKGVARQEAMQDRRNMGTGSLKEKIDEVMREAIYEFVDWREQSASV
jgi:hypothetical protein